MRDIISHHYFDLNAEAIYDVCETKIKTLAEAVKQMLKELK
ncbi:MAG: HepT-like ribonuclease domain-containing protein [Pseudomonadota bacterium]